MKCRKQIVIGIIMLLFSLLYATVSYGKTAVVDTDTLKLRKEASTESTVLELLNIGEKLEIIEETEEWAKVKVKGMTGFVHKDYIEIQEESSEEPQITENEEQSETQVNEVDTNIVEENTDTEEVQKPTEETTTESVLGEKTVKKDSNVYILPLINSSKVSEIKVNEKVNVIDETNNWAYVETEKVNGWVQKNILEDEVVQVTTTPIDETTNNQDDTTENIDTGIEETKIEEKAMYVNYSSVYVRKGPGTDYEVVDSLILNSWVIVTAESGDWYKVKVDGKEGYVAKRLLSSNVTETTDRSSEERATEGQVTSRIVTNTSKGEEIANYAKQFLGCRYVYGGSGPSTFDCSGFTMYVYKQFGVSLSHSARAQSKNGTYVAKTDLKPGDLVFFKDYETMDGIGHCGIYIGDGNFIHASSGTGYCVKISTLLSGSYNTRYETARRLI